MLPHKLTSSYVHVHNKQSCSVKTVGEMFNERANDNPDKEMYVFYADKERKTYKQIQDEVHMRMDFPLHVQHEMIKKLGIKVIVLMRSPEDLCDKASEIIPELSMNSADNLNCKGTPSLKCVINAGKKKCSGAYTLADFMNLGNEVEKSNFYQACELVDFDDPFVVIFTSGSTGHPKGVTHAHRLLSIFFDEFNAYSVDAEGNNIAWMSKYALISSFGGICSQDGALLPILYTATTVVVGPTYDTQTVVMAIQDEKVTATNMLIHHLSDILSLPNLNEYDFSSLQICTSSGTAIPRSFRERAAKITKHFLLAYGATEGFTLTQSPRDPIELREGAAYPPVPGIEEPKDRIINITIKFLHFLSNQCKIIGSDGQIVPINTPGEICIRGPGLFMHYWGDEWVVLHWELIIKEGTNIAPGDLETVLYQHPAVNNVMVVGVPDERTSEEVCACVRLYSSANVTADELKEFCRGKVSAYLVPKYILFMKDAFPTTETGKFARNQIAAQAKSLLGL